MADDILREVLENDPVEQALRAAGLPTPGRNGAEVLEAVRDYVRRYIVINHHQVTAIVLWIAHCHVIESSDVTPYLAVSSPEKRCGKTRLLEVVELLVPRPLRTSSISDAALFRSIDEERVVILLDEADAIFGPKSNREDLRALINAGYRRGAVVTRCEGEGKKVTIRHFDAFSAKAVAAIRELPDTIADRAIPIRLQRKGPKEHVERFRLRQAQEEAAPIRQALEAWSAVSHDSLREARPEIPEELNDRAQDGWEPLLAIADLAGDEWPERARNAAKALHGAQDDESYGVRLLSDIKAIFDEGLERMASAELAMALCENEEAPWGDLKGKALDARGLAGRLKPFGIVPKQIRFDEKNLRGYEREQFIEAWSRYLLSSATKQDFIRYTATPQVDSQVVTEHEANLFHQKRASELACSGVADNLPLQGEVRQCALERDRRERKRRI